MTSDFHNKLAERVKIPGGEILTYEEVHQWPPGMLEELKKAGTIRQIEPAAEVICNQCEERCLITPELFSHPETEEKVWLYVCPKKPDIGRIQVDPQQRMRWEIVSDRKKPEPVDPKVEPVAMGEVAEQKLTPANERAYQSYCVAEQKLGKCTDKKAYAWLKEQGIEGYDLPTFATWQKYVRNGRKHYKTNKNTPRAGRKTSSPLAKDDPALLSQISNRHSHYPVDSEKAD